ncbi:hypothetical protein BJD55_gp052 [Gordonia phage Yvonnetastic]|uniref:Uncharacterized protein n=1 Tax=Gordonia phage Yvonnetastic TaxID=1821566 RepID=A0A142K9D1_9CAUD|nr:hypothetical protein BJD55_gp052 [Gordonia phage Yvonnetastic]AMS02714.1 hypothetical protein SEA_YVONNETASTIC_170 [Gordonia phage Yvonnetastic]
MPKRVAKHESRGIARVLAAARQHKRDQLKPWEQLLLLDARLGPGIGAVKERARLKKDEEEE